MRTPVTRRVGGIALALALLASCESRDGNDERTIVASFYPLAYAAESIAGPQGWTVVDLSAGRADAHDVELTLDQRTALEEAALVLYLGDLGFQPQVEEAVDEASGTVLAVADDVALRDAVSSDPHVWLDLQFFTRMLLRIENALEEVDPGPPARYDDHGLTLELGEVWREYERTLDDCRYDTVIVPHEAFGYLAEDFGFAQFGLAGRAPEGEPVAARVAEAQRLLAAGEAGAVFHDGHEESIRVAESIAADAEVPILRLQTLETAPPVGDFVSVMKLNLEALAQGLGCT